jgi:type IV secretion system protein VirD4
LYAVSGETSTANWVTAETEPSVRLGNGAEASRALGGYTSFLDWASSHGPLIFALCGIAIGGLCLVVAQRLKRPEPQPSGVHGMADVATDEDLAQAGLTGHQPGEGIRLGYDQSGNVIRYCGDAHLILVAPTRSGKFTNILSHALTEHRGSVIVIDPKGQIAAVTKKRREELGEVIVLSPFDEGLPHGLAELLGPTKSYNPMHLLNPKSSGFEVACDSMAETLIAEDKESKNAGYFTDNARRAIAGVIMELKLHYPPEEQNLARVCEIMCTNELFNFSSNSRDFRDSSPFVVERLSQFMGGEKQRSADDLQGIIRTAQGQLAFVSSAAMRNVLQRSDFCFDDLKRRPTTVFLVLPSKFLSPCRKWFRLVIGSAVEELISTQKGTVPVLAIMDEFAQLGRVPVIETAMSEAAGHGLQLWPILQNIPQLAGLYGRSWKTFMSGAQIQQYFRPNEDETADYVSKNAGRRTVITRHQNYDPDGEETSSGTGETGQPVYDAHQVMGLDNDKCLIFARGMVKNIIEARRRPYWKDGEVQRHCCPDPYHLPPS